jgi:hypothetical protein
MYAASADSGTMLSTAPYTFFCGCCSAHTFGTPTVITMSAIKTPRKALDMPILHIKFVPVQVRSLLAELHSLSALEEKT